MTSYGGATSLVSSPASAYRIPGSARTSAIGASSQLYVAEVRHSIDLMQAVEHARAHGVVDREDHHRPAARSVPADEHARDVDVVLAKNGADAAHDARLVLVLADEEAALRDEVHSKPIDAHDSRLVHQHSARELVAVHAQRDQAGVAAAGRSPALDDLHAAAGGDETRVDCVDPVLGEALQHALDSGGDEQVDVVLGQLPLEIQLDHAGAAAEQLRVQRGEPLRELGERPQVG